MINAIKISFNNTKLYFKGSIRGGVGIMELKYCFIYRFD